ncbi:MAG: excinuclease ABC subunit UvrA [Candidatus Sumerlaeaceae bacterium]
MSPRALNKSIEILGARTHNLKNISVNIPLGKLTVITGPSGSGKSSLAFDTLYAEGQRRFVESMSTYARQFIEKMERPDVDQVRNVQPAIAIEQINRVKNARSTIGTATEIADYLRLLYAKGGVTICPDCQLEVGEDSPQSVAQSLLAQMSEQRLYIIAPVPRSETVTAEALKAELVRAGFNRIYLQPQALEAVSAAKPSKSRTRKSVPVADDLPLAAEGPPRRAFLNLDEASSDEVQTALSTDIVRVIVDRLVATPDDLDRVTSAIATAFQAGRGTAEIVPAEVTAPGAVGSRFVFHSGFRCNRCGRDFPRPEPNLFSFNSPLGACSKCSGFGRVTGVDWDKVFSDMTLTCSDDFVAPFNSPSYRKNYKWIRETIKAAKIPWDVALQDLDPEQLDLIKFGRGKLEGVQAFFDWLDSERYKVQSRILTARYRGYTACPACRGTRLVPEALNVFWAPQDGSMPRRHIGQLLRLSIRDLLAQLDAMKLTPHEEELYGRVHREVTARLTYLFRVGLGYLSLDRQTRTLSGGEAQRINLATALGTALTQTLYVLDEPTVGLHPRDSRRLLEILRDLRDKGNTLVVVEHDPEIILGADRILDIGPAAGSRGGELVFEGTPAQLTGNGAHGLTAKYLQKSNGAGAVKRTPKSKRPLQDPSVVDALSGPHLRIVSAREHNLKNVTVDIPLGKWVCVTGVSGSGKTTLIHNVLYEGFNQYAKRAVEDLGACERIEGLEQLDEICLIDQSAIGRSTRSNPVTYVKAYDPIRKLLASTREARSLGITESAFSFNVQGGRCEACEGTGVTTYDMHFLAEVTLPCEVCGGKRFSPRVLEVKYKGKNVDEILGMTVDDATEFFQEHTTAIRRLAPLREVGLGYLTLGQNTSTLSGGEAQRLKLASHLSGSTSAGPRTLMIFDEPTTGLHLADLYVLAGVFRRLVSLGYSLIVIEHNLEIIRHADWVVDLGPEAGDDGGYLVAACPPAQLAAIDASHTGRFLRELL